MTGGIDAWNGLRATGVPEAGMAVFSDADTPEELIALAWTFEEGSRKFYKKVSEILDDPEAANLFETLVTAEEHHKTILFKLYREISGSETVSVREDTEDLR